MIKQCLILFISNIESGYNVLGLGLTLTNLALKQSRKLIYSKAENPTHAILVDFNQLYLIEPTL